MTEIHHQSLHQHLKDSKNKSFAPVYLIYGDDFLYEQSVKHIVDAVIPDLSKQRHGHEIIRHHDASQIMDVIEKLHTYSFISQKKIIELRDSTIFVSSKNQGKLIDKIKKAYDNSDMVLATRFYRELLERLNVHPDDISDENIADILGIESNEFSELTWLLSLSEELKKNSLAAVSSTDESGLLEKAIVSGFPKNNLLIISTDTIDKRASLYKAIDKAGVIIDCAVSKGTKKSEKDLQRLALVNFMNQELKKSGKKIDPDAFELIFEKIGFDIRAFSSCLEKAIQFVGHRETIHIQDAEAVSHQVRKDPVYELTGAIMEKDAGKSLYYLSSLLDSGYHPLQILTAITNQIRRVLLIKGFLKSSTGSLWRKGIRFDQFQNEIVPAIKKYDEELLNYLDKHGNPFREKPENRNFTSKKSVSSDLILFKKDQHPYAVYALFLKAESFDGNQVATALMILSQADAAMKTSGQRPRSILEEVIIKICNLKGL
jgi:DNA polymerase-3 subunit delta